MVRTKVAAENDKLNVLGRPKCTSEKYYAMFRSKTYPRHRCRSDAFSGKLKELCKCQIIVTDVGQKSMDIHSIQVGETLDGEPIVCRWNFTLCRDAFRFHLSTTDHRSMPLFPSANQVSYRIYNKNAISTPPMPTIAAPSTLALNPSPALFDEIGVALPVPVAVTLPVEPVVPFVGVAVMVKLLLIDPVTLALVVIVVFATVIVLVNLVV